MNFICYNWYIEDFTKKGRSMKIGIVGSGKIVHEALFAIEDIKEIELSAIYVRPHSRDKGEELAEKYGIKSVFTDYDEFLEKSGTDTVYIGLVNSAHFEYSKKAVLSGKNVILEKPFTTTAAEAQELVALARENNLYVLEAITVLHNSLYEKAVENLEKIGRIRIVQCNYSQYSSRYDNYLKGIVAPAFDPALGGGAVSDINLYNIYYCVGLFGEPEEASYFCNRGFNGVDTSGIAVFNYPEFVASCVGAKDSGSPSFVCIQGEKGFMKFEGTPNTPSKLHIEYQEEGEASEKLNASGAVERNMKILEFERGDIKHRMTQEFVDFERIIAEKDDQAADHYMEKSLEVMRVLESLKKKLRISGRNSE